MTSYKSASEEIDCMVGDESMKQRVLVMQGSVGGWKR